MAVRTLKDLDRIQERGSLRLSTGQARALATCVAALLVLAFVLGLQVGRVFSPGEEELSAPDVASADRSIAEILDSYRAGSPLQPPTQAASGDEPDGVDVEEPDEEEAAGDVAEDALAQETPTPEIEPLQPAEASTPPDEPPVAVEPTTPVPLPPIPQVPQVEIVELPPGPTSRWASLPSPGNSGGYAVQLAAFSTASEAEQMASDVREAEVSVYLMEVEVGGDTWHRVRVGRFATRADASAWLGDLATLTPFDPIVVKE